jgi:hypothetical protein
MRCSPSSSNPTWKHCKSSPPVLSGRVVLSDPQGPQGPFAPIFEQHFASPEMVWVINHNMDLYPVVTLYDENHEEITGDVMTPDRNTVIVTFVVPFAGTARLKG